MLIDVFISRLGSQYSCFSRNVTLPEWFYDSALASGCITMLKISPTRSSMIFMFFWIGLHKQFEYLLSVLKCICLTQRACDIFWWSGSEQLIYMFAFGSFTHIDLKVWTLPWIRCVCILFTYTFCRRKKEATYNVYVRFSMNSWVSQIELLILIKVSEAETWWDSFAPLYELKISKIFTLVSSSNVTGNSM